MRACEHLRTLLDAGVEVVATAVSAELADRLPDGVGRGRGRRRGARGPWRLVAPLRGAAPRRPGEAVRLRRARALARARAARRARADGAARARPSPWSATRRCEADVTGAVRSRRHGLPVRGRLDARPRAGLGRGLPQRRDPEAVHDHDDGPVPGGDVRPGAVVLRGVARRAARRGRRQAPTRPARPRGPRPGRSRSRRSPPACTRSSTSARRCTSCTSPPGARLDRSGGWLRPFSYGDWREEYRAVRERVSLMDVGTLGKFTIAGPDADELVDRRVPVPHRRPASPAAPATCSRSTRPGT